jgi:hypothetical protein
MPACERCLALKRAAAEGAHEDLKLLKADVVRGTTPVER